MLLISILLKKKDAVISTFRLGYYSVREKKRKVEIITEKKQNKNTQVEICILPSFALIFRYFM